VSAIDAAVPSVPATQWSPADLRMRRLLALPTDAPTATTASAVQLVERSLLISAARCLLTYIILPFVAPILGFAAGVAPVVGISVGAVAIAANVASVRRVWRADHRYRWHYTALAGAIVVALVWLIVADVLDLVA
jgi:multisubunit Na+/H+ antiporter MnhB subunit